MELSQAKVDHMMSGTVELAANYMKRFNFCRRNELTSARQVCVSWIQKKCFGIKYTPDDYDTSIQILDTFLCCLPYDFVEFHNDRFLCLIGTVCLLISLKINNVQPILTNVSANLYSFDLYLSDNDISFQAHFKDIFLFEELVSYEKLILENIEFNINPQSTPSNFVRCLLLSMNCPTLKEAILAVVGRRRRESDDELCISHREE